jgi:hypothetical protein
MTGGFQRSYSSVRVMLAAGLLAGGAALMPAAAADLGGNCCADLEERVAELEATTARKGNRKVSLTISGQVSTALMFWDDGHRSDTYVVDNTVSRTGFQFDGSARINPNLTAGFQLVIGISSGARSHQVNQKDDDATTVTKSSSGVKAEEEATLAIELANWYLDHKHFGRLAVGRVGTAADGTTIVDLGGAGVIANAEIGEWQQGFLAVGNTKWVDVFGGSTVSRSSQARGNGIIYSTPTLHGFSAAVSWSENDMWDAALRYAAEWHGIRVAAAIAYTSNHGGTDEVTPDIPYAYGPEPTKWQGSASMMHMASGLYLTGAFVNQDNDSSHRPDTRLWYVQGGVARNWTGLGNTVLYGEYARVDDGLAGQLVKICTHCYTDLISSSEASVWGLGVVQHIDAAAMELFLAYRRYSAEITSPTEKGEFYGTLSLDDFDVVMSGARIRF